MGDTGSMFLGLLLGALAMNNAYTQHNGLAALAPVLILGVPLFDMIFVMYIRWRRGLPVMLGSPDHVALRLREWRLTTRQTVLASYAAGILLGAAASLVEVGHRHAVTARRQRATDRAADASRSSGHQGDALVGHGA